MTISIQPTNRALRTGAAMFFLWGILHIYAGVAISVPFLLDGPGTNFALFGIVLTGPLTPGELLGSHIAMNFGFDLAGYGILAIWLSWYLWTGVHLKLSFSLSLVMLGIADAAFINSLLLPGYSPIIEGLAGPLFYVLGVIFGGYGLGQLSKQGKLK